VNRKRLTVLEHSRARRLSRFEPLRYDCVTHNSTHSACGSELRVSWICDGSAKAAERLRDRISRAIFIGRSTRNVGYYPSLALDAAGHPRIVYMDLDHHTIKVASKHTAGWTLGTVGPSPQYDGFTSIVLDALGNTHVTHAGPVGLMYAVKSGTSRQIETVDSYARETTGYVTSALALDSSANRG